MLFAVLLSVSSCAEVQKGELAGGAPTDPVTDLTATPDYGAVVLHWTNPVDTANLYYCKISYVDASGKTVNQKVYAGPSADSIPTAVCSGFADTNTYTFTVRTVTYGGVESAPVTVDCAPLDAATIKDGVFASIECDTIEYGFCLKWVNETGYPTNIVVSYTADGVDRTETIDATETGSRNFGEFTSETTVTAYAVNPYSGAQTESKSWTILPKTNPFESYDPVYAKDYITFSGGGGSNSVTVTKVDDPKSPVHFAFSTTGGDPYTAADGLNQRVKGYVCVFRYKINQNADCEFFWCNSPYAATGGRETHFNLEKNASWTTFIYDFTADCRRHNWTGAPGYSVRFDIGNGSGINLEVKNMRWTTLDEIHKLGYKAQNED